MPAATIPTNLPTRWYPQRAFTVDGVRQIVPAGVYTDHTAASVEQVVYDLRNRQGEDAWTHYEISDRLGLGHWRVSYNVGRNLGRRVDGEPGRNLAGDLTYRSWNRTGNMRNEPAAPARPGSRPDTSIVTGRFGIEIEFNVATGSDYYAGETARRDAVDNMQEAGIAVALEGYNHHTRSHWKMTTDATVTGGECVSPIMAGDTASLDEVRDVLRCIKAAGGVTRATVGMHVHHDATGFATPESRTRLVNLLRWAEQGMAAYVVPQRISTSASCGATLMQGSHEWDSVARHIVNIIPGSRPNGYNSEGGTVSRYRFFNIEAPMLKYGTVEFRGLGGTLHAGKVRVWVRMGQAIMKLAASDIEVPAGTSTPESLVAMLRQHNLIGAQTAIKFLSECGRRTPSDDPQA